MVTKGVIGMKREFLEGRVESMLMVGEMVGYPPLTSDGLNKHG